MIELEQLAPYLPYGLRIKENNTEFEMTGSFLDEWFNYGSPMKGMPILRPISDLDKEIKVNDDYVITMEEIFISAFGGIGGCGITNNGDKIFIAQDCTEKITFNTSYLCFETYAIAPDGESEWNPAFNQLQLFEKLYEYHFDVFGLIEQGLAIDINTLES